MFIRAALATTSILALLLALPAAAEAPENEQDKLLYFFGNGLGQQLGQFKFDEREIGIVLQGARSRALGEPLELDPREYEPKLQAYMQERLSSLLTAEADASKAYLAEQAKGDGAQVQDSGLIYTEVTAGSGENPSREDKVRVHYKGTLRDGTVFDATTPERPAEFQLSGVIPCWTEALTMMKPGGKARIICPPELAYKERGFPGTIPGNAALTFDVELIEVVAASAPE